MKWEHSDALVIGSGFGGAAAAFSLAQAGQKVLMLERGGWARRDELDWDQREILLKQRYKSESPLLVRQYGDRKFRKVYANEVVGGKSVFYGGASLRLREKDFSRWPISYADLEKYYARAERLLGVHGQRGQDPCEPPGVPEYPFASAELSQPAQRIWEAGWALGYRPFRMPLAINFSDPARPLCIRCITCDGFPCRIEAKNDLASTLLKEAQARGLEIVASTLVRRLRQKGGRVQEVECLDRGTLKEFSLSADVVVLAAGALHSPALLLRSGFDHPLIGRFLMRHCNGVASYLFPFKTNPQQVFHKQVCFSDFYEDLREELGTSVGVIQDIYTPAAEVIRHHAPLGLKTVAGLVSACMQNLLCIAEDEPQPGNRVSLAEERDRYGMELVKVEHQYTPGDCRRRDYLLDRARRVLRRAGGWVSYTYAIDTFSHALGTLRCGWSPGESVLDRDCRYWGAENLYVLDGGFMPSSGGVNPSLTIAANALRVADRILGARP
jgi:choline dehydrogenase-like flavoprotein